MTNPDDPGFSPGQALKARAKALNLHGLLAHWPDGAAWAEALIGWEEEERDIDIKGFFDSIDHELLLKAVCTRSASIGDGLRRT